MCSTAKALSRNPLGIIALFIVLVYGFASLVTTFSSAFTHDERILLVYFLVTFPVLVLLIFAWLVSCHSSKLFGPTDFKNEDNYVRMHIAAAISLATASAKDPSKDKELDINNLTNIILDAGPVAKDHTSTQNSHILWVDDRPENNVYERRAFEAIGISFSLALTTSEALSMLHRQKFAAVISDMGRKEGPREGYKQLDTMRAEKDYTPLFFYAASNAPEHIRETKDHGGQGCTNNAQDLFEMVTKTIINRH
ncbi:MAG: response regulator [Desulfovibrio sp.]|jgi:CheY-like chemotaxis protein|nr:response regulator [Desulfovibrio sp.]